MLALSDLTEMKQVFPHAVIENGECFLLKALGEDSVGDDTEVAGSVNLWAVARAIVDAAPRPLFTLMVPRGFRSE